MFVCLGLPGVCIDFVAFAKRAKGPCGEVFASCISGYLWAVRIGARGDKQRNKYRSNQITS